MNLSEFCLTKERHTQLRKQFGKPKRRAGKTKVTPDDTIEYKRKALSKTELSQEKTETRNQRNKEEKLGGKMQRRRLPEVRSED